MSDFTLPKLAGNLVIPSAYLHPPREVSPKNFHIAARLITLGQRDWCL